MQRIKTFVNWLFVEKIEIYDGNWCSHYDTRFGSTAKPVAGVVFCVLLVYFL